MAPEIAETEVLHGVRAAISRETVQLYLRTFGRGPTKARTYVQSDYAVCVLRDIFTTGERTLIANGGREQVEESRKKINDAIDGEFVAVVERETGRPVQTHLTHIKVPANLALHFFLFDSQSNSASD
ncbi:MAG TPA: Na-translocating system protein MpsC family protein [Solirubrobacterales bacterium]|nr:Na-translocating system protein MpsC family protein [Solirubrobacterales bacterium]